MCSCTSYLFIYFQSDPFLNFFVSFIWGPAGPLLLLCGLSCSCCKWGPPPSCSARVSHCSGLSCGRAQALGRMRLSNCSSWALEHGLSNCDTHTRLLHSTWDLPGPGIEPLSPAQSGGFFTAEPPGKLQSVVFIIRKLEQLPFYSFKVFFN